MTVRILVGHVIDRLKELPDECVNCVVSSPPYWGLRDYGTEPQVWGGDPGCEHEWGEEGTSAQRLRNGIGGTLQDRIPVGEMLNPKTDAFCLHCEAWRGHLGLEPDYRLYVDHIVTVFDEVRRVLHADGTLWLVIGDCYATGAGLVGGRPGGGAQGDRWNGYPGSRGFRGQHLPHQSGKAGPRIAAMGPMTQPNRMPQPGLKPKDLVGIPFRVAFALQDAGWWLRKDNVWNKPNPMPESVQDRCTTSHEFVFHLSKSERYWYDAEAIMERFETDPRENYPTRAKATGRGDQGFALMRGADRDKSGGFPVSRLGRNKRSVWTIATVPSDVQHFATFPPALIEPCILAGCPLGGTVLDPFIGVGTTAIVADKLARNCIGIELHPGHAATAARRAREPGFALEPAAAE